MAKSHVKAGWPWRETSFNTLPGCVVMRTVGNRKRVALADVKKPMLYIYIYNIVLVQVVTEDKWPVPGLEHRGVAGWRRST